jgi:carnitine-CoA ligase
MKQRATVPELLRQRAADHPDRLFVWCGTERLTYEETDRRTNRLAAGFQELGVEPGDRVAVITPNRLEMLELYFALAKVGAIQVPLNAYLKGQFLQYQLGNCRATTVVCDEAGRRALAPLLADLPELERIVLLDAPQDTHPGGPATIPYADLDLTGATPRPHEPTPADLMSIVYTSGTTGFPKGCMLPHGYYSRVAEKGVERLGLTEADVYLTMMPLFHASARMHGVGATLIAGAAIVVEPQFSPSRVLPRARETGATLFGGVGAMGIALLNQPPSPADRDHDLRLMSFVPFTPARQEEVERRFGVEMQCELYGQTECFPLTYNPLRGERKRDSDGRPASDLEVRLVDDEDRDVPVGQPGEIIVRPRDRFAMFSGYWGKPEATLEAFRYLWYHTGDFGRADDEGFIRFVDRKKDAMRRRGENVSSLEVESAIVAHPAVEEVAVHAVASDMSEDDIKACLVLRDGAEVSPAELFEFFKDNLPYYAIPRYVEVLPELPKNAVSRVMKHQLRGRGVSGATIDLEALGYTVARAERR